VITEPGTHRFNEFCGTPEKNQELIEKFKLMERRRKKKEILAPWPTSIYKHHDF